MIVQAASGSKGVTHDLYNLRAPLHRRVGSVLCQEPLDQPFLSSRSQHLLCRRSCRYHSLRLAAQRQGWPAALHLICAVTGS